MNPITERFIAEFAELLTTALMHFVWQGAVLSLALVALVKLFALKNAQQRYLLSVGTLVLMGVAPFFTANLSHNGRSVPESPFVVASDPSNPVIEVRSDVVVDEQLATVTAGNVMQNQPAISAPRWNGKVEFYVLIVWLAGVLVLSTRLAIGFGITLWIRANVKPLCEHFEQRVRILGDRLGVNARQRVFTCMRVGQAVAVGFIRPIALVPVAWLTQLTPEMLEAVIAHELAHIRRWDLWVNLGQRVIETLLFYHPAVWWLSRRIRLEREMCCDEIAAGCFDRAMYARSLESVARIAHGNLLMAASINGEKKMNLLSRIQYLLGVAPAEAAGNCWAVGLVALILPFAAVVAFSLTAGTTPSVAMADDNLDESKAIENIELLGGKITRDKSLPGRPVVEIDLRESKILTDSYLPLLKSFRRLKSLNLSGTAITDEGVKEFRELTTLQILELNGTNITDNCLKEIGEVTNLTYLSLLNTRITDRGLKRLKESLPNTTFDHESSDESQAIQRLRRLGWKVARDQSLPERAVTMVCGTGSFENEALKELVQFKNLTTLIVDRPQFTDVGLRILGELGLPAYRYAMR